MAKATGVLSDDIAAFDAMEADFKARHSKAWVVFFQGRFVGAFETFEDAASTAVERFDDGPYLIRQVGAAPMTLSGGMVFRPAHAHDPGRV